MRKFYLFLYYSVVQFLPSQPFPGYKIVYKVRYFVLKKIIKHIGSDVIVKARVYFGEGLKLSVGDNSHLGENATLGGEISIGKDVQMGPDVVMMTVTHEHSRTDIPIMYQGATENMPIVIGDGVWIGTRAILMPGVKIGDHSIVGAGAVVTKSCEPYSIIGGVPAKLIRKRK